MKKKADFFLENKSKIHVSLKTGTFYNGLILEIREEFFILDDLVLGKLPVFFSEIKEDGLEPFNERREIK